MSFVSDRPLGFQRILLSIYLLLSKVVSNRCFSAEVLSMSIIEERAVTFSGSSSVENMFKRAEFTIGI
jgi:hypothetical protein